MVTVRRLAVAGGLTVLGAVAMIVQAMLAELDEMSQRDREYPHPH